MATPRVVAYSIDALVQLLAEVSPAEEVFVRAKPHRQFLEGYFRELGAATMVVEESYIDHDYLEDYTGYYARCFESYERDTARLHFFNHAFTTDDLLALLSGKTESLTEGLLQEHYLGFMVVKPLPQTIIGRTCLRSYPDAGRRNFPILRDYEANLFGIRLVVQSLAYQEQDSVVAACATSALWSCFHATGRLFGHIALSPVEITKAAAKSLPEESFIPGGAARALPNSGLTPTQMAAAVREVGLEPHIVAVSNADVLNSTIYAYADGRIPCVLVVSLFDQPNGKVIGRHAVTVTGYSLGKAGPSPVGSSGALLRSSRIDRIYAHDDQVGPFARMVHATLPTGEFALSTSWPGGQIFACPELAIVPLYNKIRIPLSWIQRVILLLDEYIELVRLRVNPGLARPEWDIYLTTVNEFKGDLHRKAKLSPNPNAEESLTQPMPKYLWCAVASCGSDEHLGLIFDATGIQQSNLLTGILEFRPELGNLLRSIPNPATRIPDLQVRAIVERFAAMLSPS